MASFSYAVNNQVRIWSIYFPSLFSLTTVHTSASPFNTYHYFFGYNQ